MGCLLWPIRLILTIIETADRINEVDKEIERIRESHGDVMATMYKKRLKRGLEIRLALCIIGITGTIIFGAIIIYYAATN